MTGLVRENESAMFHAIRSTCSHSTQTTSGVAEGLTATIGRSDDRCALVRSNRRGARVGAVPSVVKSGKSDETKSDEPSLEN
jgi:hypothetical protein